MANQETLGQLPIRQLTMIDNTCYYLCIIVTADYQYTSPSCKLRSRVGLYTKSITTVSFTVISWRTNAAVTLFYFDRLTVGGSCDVAL